MDAPAFGLLWYDDSDKPLADKVRDAARRYELKFGVKPNFAFVRPADADGLRGEALPVPVGGYKTVLKNHVWVGVTNEQSAKADADVES